MDNYISENEAKDKIEDRALNPDDIAAIYFTSGTTMESKAVPLTHKNICENIINTNKIFNLSNDDISLSILPSSHVLEGLFCSIHTMVAGAKKIICNELDDIINYIKKYKVTFIGGVPAIYKYLLNYKDELKGEASHINMFMSGGAKLDESIIKEYNKLGITMIQGYGMTECSPVISIENKSNNKLGSVGKVINGLDIKIKNTDNEDVGTIFVKGDSIFKEYYNDKKITDESFKNNWFNTGDLGRLDNDGYLFICGREKDLIVLDNGKKIYPEEIESILNNKEEIKESFIYNIDNKIYAKIVSDKSKEDLKELISSINNKLPQYKQIHDYEISNEEIIRNAIGKIKRNHDEKLFNFLLCICFLFCSVL